MSSYSKLITRKLFMIICFFILCFIFFLTYGVFFINFVNSISEIYSIFYYEYNVVSNKELLINEIGLAQASTAIFIGTTIIAILAIASSLYVCKYFTAKPLMRKPIYTFYFLLYALIVCIISIFIIWFDKNLFLYANKFIYISPIIMIGPMFLLFIITKISHKFTQKDNVCQALKNSKSREMLGKQLQKDV